MLIVKHRSCSASCGFVKRMKKQEERTMKVFVTITGLNHYYGTSPFHEGQKLTLVKEPENRHDTEAIRAELPGLGLVGYVANSTYTVQGECMSAGRLYDKIGDRANARVQYILANSLVCQVKAHTESCKDSASSDGK